MTPVFRNEAVWSIDDLELELRKLPGVRAAGFDDVDDLLMVQLHVSDTERVAPSEGGDPPVPVSASRIAARHSDRPVAVEIVRWRSLAAIPQPVAAPGPPPIADADAAATTPEPASPAADEDDIFETEVIISLASRARLLAVLAFPDTDELEVHLVLGGKRTIGRAPASAGIEGAVTATIDAVRDLGAGLHPRMQWARAIGEAAPGDEVVVAVALGGVDDRAAVHYGLAGGISLIDAAARATLDALNRQLSRIG
jgi:hypothetical protein